MPAKFDWQAEDEHEWGDFEPDGAQSSVDRRPRRRLMIIVLALLVGVAAIVVGFLRLEQFLDDSNDGVKEDVLVGHELVLSAAAEGDAELFENLILDRLNEWTDAQVSLAEAGLLLDRRPLDLYLPTNAEPVSLEVELLPNLREAEVLAAYRYQLAPGGAGTDSVTLRQFFSYRQQDDQWLLNPPTAAFWGSWESASGRYLTLNYPQRDQQIGQRLAADLEAVLGQACHSIEELRCPADMSLQVDLVADPGALVDMSTPASRLVGGRHLALPTPTLTGVPVDQSAYRALYRAYAQRIVSRLIVEQTGAPAVEEQALFRMALLDIMLDRLGLRNWSLTVQTVPADADQLLAQANNFWNSNLPVGAQLDETERQPVYALIDFLVAEWSLEPPAQMLRVLGQAGSLSDWIGMIGPASSETSFSQAWQTYVAHNYPEASPTTWPNEVILLMCDLGIVGSSNLYRYDPVNDLLTVEMSGRELIDLEPLPDGEGVVLTEQSLRGDDQRQFLWQAGRIVPYEQDGEEVSLDGVDQFRRSPLGRFQGQNDRQAWSSDGRWLAELDDDSLIISAPVDGFRQEVEHGAQECRGLAWVRASD